MTTPVGAVSLSVLPSAGTFAADLQKISDAAAAKAGSSAGKIWQREFIAAQRQITLAPAFQATERQAATSGLADGKVYARGFGEGVRVNGQAATALAGVQAEALGTVGAAADKSSLAARRMAASVASAAQTATAANRRAADAATALAKAQEAAAVAADKAAKGEITQEEATKAAETATLAQTKALDLQARAALAVEKASIAAANAEVAAADRASAAVARQTEVTAAAAARQAEVTTAAASTALPNALNRGAATATLIAGREGGAAGRAFGTAFGNSAVPLAGVVIAAASIKLAGNFEQQTNVLVTAAGEQEKNLANIRKGILDIATSTGTAWQQETDAAYAAEKAGLRNNDVIETLRAASQGAKEEGAQLSTVTAGLTTVMADYNLGASDAVSITNALKTGAGQAKTTFELFTGSLGAVLPRAAAAKVSLGDVLGVLDSVTQAGFSAQQGSQNIAATIVALSNPLGPARKELGQLGIDSVDLSTKLGDGPGGRGLAGTLNYLSETILKRLGPSGTLLLNTFNQSKQAATAATTEYNALAPATQKLAKQFEDGQISAFQYQRGLRSIGGEQGVLGKQFLTTYTQAHGFQDILKQGGPQAQTYLGALKQVVGGQAGLTVALATTGGQFQVTQKRADAISKSLKDGGKDVEGWAITQKNFNTQLGQLGQEAQRAGIQIGTWMLPKLKETVGFLVKHPIIFEVAAAGIGLLTAKFIIMKAVGLYSFFEGLSARILATGTAATTAATEVSAASTVEAEATGAAGAAGAARAGIGRTALAGLSRLIIPVAITYGALKVSGTYNSLSDLLHGQFSKAYADTPAWAHTLGQKIGDSLFGGLSGSFDPKTLANFKDPAFLLKTQSSKVTSYVAAQVQDINQKISAAAQKGDFNSSYVQGLEKQRAGLLTKLDQYGDEEGKREAQARINAYLKALAKAPPPLFGPNSVTRDPAAGKPALDQYLKDNGPAGQKRGQAALNILFPLAGIDTIKRYTSSLADFSNQVSTNNKTLVGDSLAASVNRQSLTTLVDKAKDAAKAYSDQTGKTSDYTKALQLAIPQIETAATKTGLNKQQVDNLISSLGLLPPDKAVPVTTPGAGAAIGAVQGLNSAINALPSSKTISLDITAGISSGLSGLLSTSANGNLFERHDAQIARPGAMRLWAEPETGGEAYIPLAPQKRARSLDIWAKTGKHLGVSGFADGGIRIDTSSLGFGAAESGATSVIDKEAARAGAAVLEKIRQAQRSAAAAAAKAAVAGALGGQVSNAANEALANAMMAAHGWNTGQIAKVDAIWTQESSFNQFAQNPAGGPYNAAYGIPQSNPGSKMASAGPDWLTNPATQIRWGIGYIDERYGGPDGAYAYKLATGVYDAGGVLPAGAAALNRSGTPEAVLTAAQWKTIEQFVAQVAKIGVTGVLKTTTGDITKGTAAIAAAVKEGNGPLQNYISLLVKDAQGKLYATGLRAVADKKVSPAEAAAVGASAKKVTDLTAILTKLNTVNAGLVTSLTTFVQSQTSFRDTLQGNLSTGAGFSDLLKLSGSPADLKTAISTKLAAVKGFTSKLTLLKKKGFSDAIIRDVANDGVDAGNLYADLLLTSTPADIRSINSTFGQLTAAELGGANSITKATEGAIPGLTKAAASTYIQTAIFTTGANVDQLVSKAEFTQRTFDGGGYLMPGQTILATNATNSAEKVLNPAQTKAWEGGPKVVVEQNNTYQGVDLATAHAQSSRDLALALASVGVD